MRQNPHVRICGGPGSATTLVYPTAARRWLLTSSRWLDPLLGRETVDPPGHIGLIGEVAHAPRPRAPAASWPAHERPGGRVPGPCRLATGQEGRVARIASMTRA